jgi:hypothetical protein
VDTADVTKLLIDSRRSIFMWLVVVVEWAVLLVRLFGARWLERVLWFCFKIESMFQPLLWRGEKCFQKWRKMLPEKCLHFNHFYERKMLLRNVKSVFNHYYGPTFQPLL